MCNNINPPCHSNVPQMQTIKGCCGCNSCPVFGVSCVYNNLIYGSFVPWYNMIPFWLWLLLLLLFLLLLTLITCFGCWCMFKKKRKVFDQSKPTHIHLESPPSIIVAKNLDQYKKNEESAKINSTNLQSFNHFKNNVLYTDLESNQKNVLNINKTEENFNNNENYRKAYVKTNENQQYNNEVEFGNHKIMQVDEHAAINLTSINDSTQLNGGYYVKKSHNSYTKQPPSYPLLKHQQAISRSTSQSNIPTYTKEEWKEKLCEVEEVAVFDPPLYGLNFYFYSLEFSFLIKLYFRKLFTKSFYRNNINSTVCLPGFFILFNRKSLALYLLSRFDATTL